MEKRIAILATNGFEEMELKSPMERLKEEGFTVEVVSLEEGSIKGWSKGKWSGKVKVDKLVSQVKAGDYHALVLPGGVINPDKLRRDSEVLNFVREFFRQGKPVGAICHAGWTLIEADVVKGRTMTSFSSIKTDLKNAGAIWVDKEVVVDQGLVTSRSPEDLQAFNQKLVEEIREGKHDLQHEHA